jgi:ribosome maturation factor RimP
MPPPTTLRLMAAMTSSRVRPLLEPVVTAAGYDLEDVTVTAAGRRSVLRVVVDRDGGIDLDAVAEVSRAVSEALDGTDELGASPYVLEVTSPGVDRPLTEPRHWRRAAGRLVAVEVDGKRVIGRVLSADTAGVELSIETRSASGKAGSPANAAPREVVWSDLGPGRVQVEFNRDNGAASSVAEEPAEG